MAVRPSLIGDSNFNHVKIERRVEACKRGEERRVSGGIYDALRLKGKPVKIAGDTFRSFPGHVRRFQCAA